MVSSSASASPTFSAAAGPRGLGRAQPGTLLAPPGGARPGRTLAARGDRSGWRHTRPCRRAGRDRRRPATRVCARRAGPATRRPVPCEQAYASEPRRSSSELDDLWRPFRCRRRSGSPSCRWLSRVGASCAALRQRGPSTARELRNAVESICFKEEKLVQCGPPRAVLVGSRLQRLHTGWGQRATLAQETGGIRATCRPGPDNPEGDRTQHDSAGQGPAG